MYSQFAIVASDLELKHQELLFFFFAFKKKIMNITVYTCHKAAHIGVIKWIKTMYKCLRVWNSVFKCV